MNTAQGKLFFIKYKSVNNCKVVTIVDKNA